MSLIEVLAGAHGGQSLNHFSRRFCVTPEQVRSCAERLRPILARQINDVLAEPDGAATFLGLLANPRTTAVFTSPEALLDPDARTFGETTLRTLSVRDIDSFGTIENTAQTIGISHRALRAMLPFLVLMLLGAIREQAMPVFRGVLRRLQPDDAATDPIVFASTNVAHLATETLSQPAHPSSPTPVDQSQKSTGWLDMILKQNDIVTPETRTHAPGAEPRHGLVDALSHFNRTQ